MLKKTVYQAPAMRIGGVSLELNFLATGTAGGIIPGQDPGDGGSWEFGDND